MSQLLELLAPAKDLATGRAAIDHGADAVYIGAALFGARQAAGNSVEDIAELCHYAHQFGVRVYATVNTIVYDSELERVKELLQQLKTAGIDAVLVQDMAVMEMAKEIGLTIHASTQTDNRTAEKVQWLYEKGCSRVVLARELGIEDIKKIHQAVPQVELEAFVHGALCVSYSGLCYASQHCFARSANRGACAQFCRLPFTLENEQGQTLVEKAHLLSLKDMNRLQHLGEMAAAGVCSFKIEGRLKDISYVKNVVAAYSQALDQLVRQQPDRYQRAALGHISYHFQPDLLRTFHRGYTTYGLHGREKNTASIRTPKAIGQMVGHVKELKGNSFTMASTCNFANGDGLCFFDHNGQLQGFRVNRAENNRLYPQKMPVAIQPGTILYRSQDIAFDRILAGETAQRHIPVDISIGLQKNEVVLQMRVADIQPMIETTIRQTIEPQAAQKSQAENIKTQLSKLGGTPFAVREMQLQDSIENIFIPSSQLTKLRRAAVEQLQQAVIEVTTATNKQTTEAVQSSIAPQFYTHHCYQYNIANQRAKGFYVAQGLTQPPMAFEIDGAGNESTLIMQCKYCIRYELGICIKHPDNHHHPAAKPRQLYLRSADGTRYRLQFDCANCQMNIYAE